MTLHFLVDAHNLAMTQEEFFHLLEEANSDSDSFWLVQHSLGLHSVKDLSKVNEVGVQLFVVMVVVLELLVLFFAAGGSGGCEGVRVGVGADVDAAACVAGVFGGEGGGGVVAGGVWGAGVSGGGDGGTRGSGFSGVACFL
ncbi:unnamed protein product [Schistocephalus solidus]|uniref:Uncharacterized protein n=1 Tax=Schistocephalus solidus TaxID=70667 RepID=A0A183TS58_SCHSO|nr:unnamed protein product [Schistocephalus solidus]